MWRTFFKPANLYLYTPWMSCLPRATLVGTVNTEAQRCVRTCRYHTQALESWHHLANKFRARGYPLDVLLSAEARWVSENSIVAAPNSNTARGDYIVPFKFPYFSGASKLNMCKAVYEHACSLSIFDKCNNIFMAGSKTIRVVNCWTSNRNLFRLRYRRFLGEYL